MLFLAAFLALLAVPASADSGMLMGGVANRQMPLDALTAPSECYSWRRLRTAYTANKAANIVRASDSETADIGFRASGYPDISAITAFCAATTCKVVTAYSQCGSLDITQATDANRPAVVESAIGSFPAGSYGATTTLLAAASDFTPTTGLLSYSLALNRSAGSGACSFSPVSSNTNNYIGTAGSAANARMVGGSAGFNRGMTDAAPHSVQGRANGASSALYVDGNAQAGTVTANTTAGAPRLAGAASTTCLFAEAVVWDNYGITAAEAAFLSNSQRIEIGF